MNINRLLIPLLIVFIVVGIFIYSGRQSKTLYTTATWAYRYSDTNNLKEHSDLIAVVRINDIAKEWTQDGTLLTDTNATVIEPILNAEKEQKVLITQTGGIQEINKQKVKIEIKDDPMLVKGEEYLIFARKNDKGAFTILGGPQGRFKHDNGKLYSMKYVSKRVDWGDISINGETLDKIKAKILIK